MRKVAGWMVLLLLSLSLMACAGKTTMVKCPNCGSVFDYQEHVVDLSGQ